MGESEAYLAEIWSPEGCWSPEYYAKVPEEIWTQIVTSWYIELIKYIFRKKVLIISKKELLSGLEVLQRFEVEKVFWLVDGNQWQASPWRSQASLCNDEGFRKSKEHDKQNFW
jgi:hypothetical protein